MEMLFMKKTTSLKRNQILCPRTRKVIKGKNFLRNVGTVNSASKPNYLYSSCKSPPVASRVVAFCFNLNVFPRTLCVEGLLPSPTLWRVVGLYRAGEQKMGRGVDRN